MGIAVQKSAIDIGIIAKDIDAMITFYSEGLGLELEASIPMPGGGTMNRFKVGDSIVKVIALDPAAPAEAPPGGIRGATGYRYWTIHIPNLEETVTKIEGDVFLVKGDGSPKPSAAKEVIFIEANSFEDFLINIYLKTVESDLDSSALIIKEICKNATANINNGLQKTEALLSTNLLEQKSTGVTDQDGSCDLIQTKYDEASAVSLTNRDALNLSITKQENFDIAECDI